MSLLAHAVAVQICNNQADAYFCSQRFVFPALKCLQHSIAVTHNILPQKLLSIKWGKTNLKKRGVLLLSISNNCVIHGHPNTL